MAGVSRVLGTTPLSLRTGVLDFGLEMEVLLMGCLIRNWGAGLILVGHG